MTDQEAIRRVRKLRDTSTDQTDASALRKVLNIIERQQSQFEVIADLVKEMKLSK